MFPEIFIKLTLNFSPFSMTNSILTLSLGLIMFTLGIIGEYVGRIYFEVKDRPNYVINEIIL